METWEETSELASQDDDLQIEAETRGAAKSITANGNLLTTALVGLVMLMVGLSVGYFGRPLLAPVQAPQAAAAAAEAPAANESASGSRASANTIMEAVVAETRHFKGDPDAPVTIVEFSDFQCPYCGRFASSAGRQIDQEYIQTGRVRLGYQHYAFLGPESLWAAEASECAAEQDAFWPYHDLLFERQSGENRGAFNKDILKGFAAELGLDAAAFDACLDSGKYTSLVRAETSAAQSLGVTGTPAFLVNGRPLVGAQPFEVFQQAIEAELGSDDESTLTR